MPRNEKKYQRCINCGDEFYVKPSCLKNGIVHCSLSCRRETDTKNRIHRNCLHCGAEFEITKSALKRKAAFCSGKCAYENKKRTSGAIRNCKWCKKEFYIAGNPSARGKYCSKRCFGKAHKSGKIMKCDNCGKEVYLFKGRLARAKNHFCSATCANKFQGRNKVKYSCKICNKEFKWSASRITQANPTYCSLKCRYVDKDFMFETSVKGNLAQLHKNGLNKLELKGNEILKKLKIKFKTQVPMFKKFIVDVLIEPLKLVIQWDGEYWHSKEKRKKLDISQDAYLKKCGYNVLRITDKQIKEDINKVYDNITKAIQQINS